MKHTIYSKDKIYKVGDIIYPQENGTNEHFFGFPLTKSRWDLVLEVNKKGYPTHIRYIWDYSTVAAIKAVFEVLNYNNLIKHTKTTK